MYSPLPKPRGSALCKVLRGFYQARKVRLGLIGSCLTRRSYPPYKNGREGARMNMLDNSRGYTPW